MVEINLARKKIFPLILLGIFLMVTFIVFHFLSYPEKQPLVTPIPKSTDESGFNIGGINSSSKPTPSSEKGELGFLLLGQGDPSHEGSQLTDTLMLVYVDNNKKNVSLVSIPRDTWIDNKKINAVYVIGRQSGGETNGINSIKRAVSTVTNLPIHYVLFIDFNGFVQMIDSLGGVDVNVSKAFDDYFYPIRGKELDTCGKSPEELVAINATMSGFDLDKQYACRYEHLHFDAGKVSLNGETALKYVRSRHSGQAGGDFSRAERQQSLILGIGEKLISLDGVKKAPEFFEKMKHLVKTDLDLEAVKTIAGMIINPGQYSVKKVVLSTDNVFNSSTGSGGQYILVPKAGDNQWTEIQQYLNEQIQTPTGSASGS